MQQFVPDLAVMQNAEEAIAPGGKPGALVVNQDRILAVTIVVVTVFFWAESADIAADEARMYPRMILVALFALGVLLAARAFKSDKEQRAAAIFTSVPAFCLFLLASTLYVASVSTLGFFTASGIYMPVVAYLLGLRRHLMNLAVTAIFLLAAYLVFVVVFARPLPREIFWG